MSSANLVEKSRASKPPRQSGVSEDESDATITSGRKLFPVFCIADIPPETQDLLIRLTHESFSPSQGAAFCILASESISDHCQATSRPAKSFSTPFASKTLAELAELFKNSICSLKGWSERCFAVLDERSIKDNTCVLVSLEGEDSLLSCRCEFGISLDQLIIYETGKISMRRDAGDLLDGKGVFTEERFKTLTYGNLARS